MIKRDLFHRNKMGIACLALPLGVLLGAGCSHHGGGGTTYYGTSTSPTYTDSGAPVITEPERTPVTPTTRDAGPGTPAGDQTSADTAEAQSQGAGSRALLGQPSEPPPAPTGQAATPPSTYSQPPTATPDSSGNLVIPLFKENVNVGKREVDAGEVRVRKTVRTETVNQPVEIRTETVTIERVPSQGGAQPPRDSASQGQPFKDQEFTIHLRGEQPYIQKQIVPAGEVVARKQFQMQQTNLQAQVRRETIAVDKGNAQNVNVSPNLSNPAGGGGEVGGQSSGTGYHSEKEITELTALTSASNPDKLYNQKVRLSQAKVQKVWDPQWIIIGNQESQPIFVHLRRPATDLKEGDTIMLNGTVKECSKSKEAAETLSPEASQKLMQQPFFVEAENIQINKS